MIVNAQQLHTEHEMCKWYEYKLFALFGQEITNRLGK
jgi:hypothetical protein